MTPRIYQLATSVLPDPSPEEPPGVEGVTTVLNWLSWGVIVLGVAGFLVSAGYLAFAGGLRLVNQDGAAIAIDDHRVGWLVPNLRPGGFQQGQRARIFEDHDGVVL